MDIHPFIPLFAPEDKWADVRSSSVGVLRRHRGLESNTRKQGWGGGAWGGGGRASSAQAEEMMTVQVEHIFH